LKEKTLSNSVRESRIRERAYKLWEENGRPHGRDVELWEQAENLIGMEENPESGQLPTPSSKDPALLDVEEGEIQEHYGEIPGRLTDQGDRPQTPMRRAAARESGPFWPLARCDATPELARRSGALVTNRLSRTCAVARKAARRARSKAERLRWV